MEKPKTGSFHYRYILWSSHGTKPILQPVANTTPTRDYRSSIESCSTWKCVRKRKEERPLRLLAKMLPCRRNTFPRPILPRLMLRIFICNWPRTCLKRQHPTKECNGKVLRFSPFLMLIEWMSITSVDSTESWTNNSEFAQMCGMYKLRLWYLKTWAGDTMLVSTQSTGRINRLCTLNVEQ